MTSTYLYKEHYGATPDIWQKLDSDKIIQKNRQPLIFQRLAAS